MPKQTKGDHKIVVDRVIKKCNTCGRAYQNESDFLSNTTRWRICDRGNLWFNCSCHSTNMILKGKYDWYSPEMSMTSRASSIFNTLNSLKELPHIPSSIMHLMQLIQDPNISSNKLAEAVKKDPLIASNIFNIANNLKVSDGKKIEALEHAITYIGINSVKDIIITASIKAFAFKCDVFDSDRFWQEAFLTGKIAEKLAKKFQPSIISDQVYLGGTLCNVGKVVFAICFPDLADKIYREVKNPESPIPWVAAEAKHNAHNHQILGEIGCGFWGLPEYVTLVAGNHHTPPEVSNIVGEADFSDIIRLANQLTHWVQLEPACIDNELLKQLQDKFNLKDRKLDELVEELFKLKDH